jgi:hypothetical protein
MLKIQESKFERCLDVIAYRNKEKSLDLTQDQLEELCCLYAIEDKENIGTINDSKDEILGLNYNDDAVELVEMLATICSGNCFLFEEIERIIEISTKAFVKFYGERIKKLYDIKFDDITFNPED